MNIDSLFDKMEKHPIRVIGSIWLLGIFLSLVVLAGGTFVVALILNLMGVI